MKKIITFIWGHKIVSFVVIAVIIGGGYFGYQKINTKKSANTYTTATVEKGMLISSIFGTGQISASNQVEVKPKVSGDLASVNVRAGQTVKQGDLIAQIDTRDAQKAVRDAEVDLESAKLSLDKLKLQQQQQLRGDTLNKTYEEGMETLADFYGDFRTVFDKIEDIFFGNDLPGNENNISYYANYFLPYNQGSPIPNSSQKLFSEVEKMHQQTLTDFQTAERGSGDARGQAISSGYELAVKTAQLIKLGSDTVRPLYDYFVPSDTTTHTKEDVIESHNDNLATYASTIDTYLQSLIAAENTINSQRDAIESQPLDLRSQEIAVKQRENTLLDAEEKLADYYIRAPFDGQVTEIDADKGDNISSNDSLCTLIAEQKIAEVTLNEIDVAQVQTGQKTNLAFDAVEDLSITGKVVEVDTLGTVDQGVVSYGIKIAFDVQDERIKPGMSVTANIITESKQNVISVPNSAVKSQQGAYYVQVMEDPEGKPAASYGASNNPRSQQVEVGISNDMMTEIVSGLKEGDVVVTGTISQTNGAPTTQNEGFQLPGTTVKRGGMK